MRTESPVGARLEVYVPGPARWRVALAARLAANRPLAVGVLTALVSFAALWSYQVFVTRSLCSGNYGWALAPGGPFPVPSRAAAAGVSHATECAGWDGQFYYYLSTDPLLRDPETIRGMDDPAYRARRVLMPAVARLAAWVLGRDAVPPRLYLALHWAAVAAGVGLLAGWLAARGLSPLYALAWPLGWGVLHPTAHGLPDGACDALFLAAVLALHAGRLGWYALAASALLLGREGYAAYAGVVWLVSALGLVRWGRAGYWRAGLLTALPALPLAGWSLYLWAHPGMVSVGAFSLAQVTAAPWTAFAGAVAADWTAGEHWELRWKVASAALIVGATLLALRHARRVPAVGAALGYLGLLACLGPVVWANQLGYPKAVGAAVILLTVLLPATRSLVPRGLLVAAALLGLDMAYVHHAARPLTLSGARDQWERSRDRPAEGVRADFVLGPDVRVRATWADARPLAPVPRGPGRRVHFEAVPITIRLENRSGETWFPTPDPLGPNSVHAGLRVADRATGRVVHLDTAAIRRPVPPGGLSEHAFAARLPEGYYDVTATSVVPGRPWLHDADPASAQTTFLRVGPAPR